MVARSRQTRKEVDLLISNSFYSTSRQHQGKELESTRQNWAASVQQAVNKPDRSIKYCNKVTDFCPRDMRHGPGIILTEDSEVIKVCAEDKQQPFSCDIHLTLSSKSSASSFLVGLMSSSGSSSLAANFAFLLRFRGLEATGS